jgi:primosomal protein N'
VFINETISSLDNNQADMQELDKKLLRGFFRELRRTGKCNYPPFVKYVKFARDIEKSQHLRDNIETVETAVEQIRNGFQQ